MRVLMVEHFLPTNTYVLGLAKELNKYVNLSILCAEAVRDQEDGISFIPRLYTGGAYGYKKVVRYLIALWNTAIQIMFGKFDIVHVQTIKLDRVELPLYSFLVRHKRKLVYTVHNVLPREIQTESVSDDALLYKKFYDRCDALIVHNKISQEVLVNMYGIEESKIAVIPHGAYYRNAPAQICKINRKTTFLMFGIIRKYKGVDIFLNAISRIPKEIRYKMHFVVAGKQQQTDDTAYEVLAGNLGIKDCIEFINRRIEDEELETLFNNADALVLPYRQIWGSGALLMAYSYYKPVIASNLPVFVEETENGKTGMLFEKNNPDSLADALIAFQNLSEDRKTQISSNIKELVDLKYNWRHSAIKTYDLYKSMV